MAGGDPELPANVELQNMLYQLQVYEALVVAANDAHAALDAMLGASDPESGRRALEERFGFTDVQATAVLDLQFRRMTGVDRQKIEQRRDEIADRVRFLEGELGET